MPYDPEPKKRRKAWILLILAFLGLDKAEYIPPVIMDAITWATPQDRIRQLATQLLVEARISPLKDWVIEDEDACDLCKYYAASGPYEVSVAGPDTHPNCRCYWVPHIE
jgi:hypothetical protein